MARWEATPLAAADRRSDTLCLGFDLGCVPSCGRDGSCAGAWEPPAVGSRWS
jgi:hypothetical protein